MLGHLEKRGHTWALPFHNQGSRSRIPGAQLGYPDRRFSVDHWRRWRGWRGRMSLGGLSGFRGLGSSHRAEDAVALVDRHARNPGDPAADAQERQPLPLTPWDPAVGQKAAEP